MSAQKFFTLTAPDGQQLELPLLKATDGPDTINISSVYKKLNCFSFDAGFVSTASCASEITYIDGDLGLLRYRGYPIEQLAEQSNYPETAYLLLYKELPNTEELAGFNRLLEKELPFADRLIPDLLKTFPANAHPMAMLMAALCALAAQHHSDLNIDDDAYRKQAAHRVIAQVASIIAAIFRHMHGKDPLPPQSGLGYMENFMHMMSGCEENSPLDAPQTRDLFTRAMDLILILHADHEQNASTSTVRMAGSTNTSPYAALTAGVAALWGPAHGGANEAVLRMLDQIISSGKPLSHYIDLAKDSKHPFRLMGFGHRVYKNYDPRAKIIRETCHKIIAALGDDHPCRPMLEVAIELERVALEDEYFISRKLYPNVDFYSGIIFSAMGLPVDLFTTLFALARTSGWISHWKEMHEDPKLRISRPRQLYTGHSVRDYVPVDKR